MTLLTKYKFDLVMCIVVEPLTEQARLSHPLPETTRFCDPCHGNVRHAATDIYQHLNA
jgi:hypothetical protein